RLCSIQSSSAGHRSGRARGAGDHPGRLRLGGGGAQGGAALPHGSEAAHRAVEGHAGPLTMRTEMTTDEAGLPTYAGLELAIPVVRRLVRPTPLYEWPALSRLLGCRFLLKHENHTPTGAFKVRGGVNLVHHLSPAERERGVLGCTTGNHGQSLAYACRQF